MRVSGNTPPPSLRIIWSLSPLALTPTEAHMLRFLACTNDHYGIHTHAICTVPKLKLPLIRSLLYRRIFEFCFLLLTQNYCLYYICNTNSSVRVRKLQKSRTRNSRRLRPPLRTRSLLLPFKEKKVESLDCLISEIAPQNVLSSSAKEHILFSLSSCVRGYLCFDRSCRLRS